MSALLGARRQGMEGPARFLAYGGPYELKMQEGQVVHEVVVASDDTYVGGRQPRAFEVEGNRLVLARVGPVNVWGRKESSRLVWRRADKRA